LKLQIEIGLPAKHEEDVDPLLKAAQGLVLRLAYDSKHAPLANTTGGRVKLFFSDAGSAALARREWGPNIPCKVLFYQTRGISDTAVEPQDDSIVLVAPFLPDFDSVEKIVRQATNKLKPVILLNHNLYKGIAIGFTGRVIRRFLSNFCTCYCLQHYGAGIVLFRCFPGYWQVISVRGPDDVNYEVLQEFVHRPTRKEIYDLVADRLGEDVAERCLSSKRLRRSPRPDIDPYSYVMGGSDTPPSLLERVRDLVEGVFGRW